MEQFKGLFDKVFTIEDVKRETGLPASTLRTWPARGIVSLDSSHNPGKHAGRGDKSLYSVYDAIQFIFLARISKDGLSVKGISECCMSEILDEILERLNNISQGMLYGNNYNPTDKEACFERYMFIFAKNGSLFVTQQWNEWRNYNVYSFHCIDIVSIAASMFRMYCEKVGKIS